MVKISKCCQKFAIDFLNLYICHPFIIRISTVTPIFIQKI